MQKLWFRLRNRVKGKSTALFVLLSTTYLYCVPSIQLSTPHNLVMTPEKPPLTIAQVTAIRFSYLLDESATIKSLAEEYELPQYRVASLLKGKDFDAFKDDFHATMTDAARNILQRSAEQAALLWQKSMLPAALKGDHRPMKDLLTAIKAIDPEAKAPALTIQIGLSLSDAGALLTTIDTQPVISPQPQSQLPAVASDGLDALVLQPDYLDTVTSIDGSILEPT